MADPIIEDVEASPPFDPEARPLCLFDLDGVLTDPIPGIISCHRTALELAGENFDELVEALDGVAATELVRAAPDEVYRTLGVDTEKTEAVLAEYREHRPFAGLQDQLYEGIGDVLNELAEAGWDLGVATNQLEPLALRLLERLEITSNFIAIVGSDVARTRPHKPQVISHLLTELDHHPKGVVVVGDRATDMEAAKALSMTAIGAAWGFGSIEELMAAQADAVAITPADVAELLISE